MQCPGQDSRFWGSGAIFETACPQCGKEVEFFKDEPTRACKGCGFKIVNPKMDFGCASYCQFAEQCVGDLPAELLAQRKDLFKDRVAVEMKRYFQYDFKRIGHATKVARYAERIVKQEGGDPAVVLSAAYLHDIGTNEAERKYEDSDVRHHEEEGPPIARQILGRLKAAEPLIDEVCAIISHHHHPGQEDTVNFKVVYDADLIVNLEERQKEAPVEEGNLAASIDRGFLTAEGRALARKVLFKER
ncbi:MAG: HD domain-containing protein [Deltaproteobacteria bacterium]|nr:HD domain-containing protein [Deltaproteobacteria bacterium]